MGRFVIGDIHGCDNEVRYLIDALPLVSGDRVVFLGDYIDRGPNSNAVVSYLIELRNKLTEIEFVFLKGNHEDMLLSYLGLNGQHGDMFVVNGGAATFVSYGLRQRKPPAEDALAAIPSEHLVFFQNLQSYSIMEPFLCVHAGIEPTKALSQQTGDELFWIRNKFIFSSHALPYTVLFGHTPQHTILYDLPYKIGLDTGLVYGNMLTCLEVDAKNVYQIHRGKKEVRRTSVQRMWKRPPAFL